LFTSESNSRFAKVPGYGLVNARIGIRSEDGLWDVSVWARNLTDKNYFNTLRAATTGLVQAILGEPRTVGATLRTRL
jgi:iron complex outermembrane receptor protein